MKNSRIKNFNDFVNESYNPELNEGFFSGIANLIKKVKTRIFCLLKIVNTNNN